jgi:hypothetical protein
MYAHYAFSIDELVENNVKISFHSRKVSFDFWIHLYFIDRNPRFSRTLINTVGDQDFYGLEL